jgi:hypothetical protein
MGASPGMQILLLLKRADAQEKTLSDRYEGSIHQEGTIVEQW